MACTSHPFVFFSHSRRPALPRTAVQSGSVRSRAAILWLFAVGCFFPGLCLALLCSTRPSARGRHGSKEEEAAQALVLVSFVLVPGRRGHAELVTVHKETIDAVPNAIPGRTDIELEIYGMEGIPEKDMDERRRLLDQKTQDNQKKKQDDSDEYDDDESPASTSYQQPLQAQQSYIPPMAQPGLPPGGTPGMPPGLPPLMGGVPQLMSGMPPVMQGMHHPGMMQMGGMMHHRPGIPPMMPGLPPGIPPPVGPRPGSSMPPMTQAQQMSAQSISRLQAPGVAVPNPQPPVTKPLFPSAGQAQPSVAGPVGTDFKPLHSVQSAPTEPPKPTFPAYTQPAVSTTSTTNSTAVKPVASITNKPATLTTIGATSKLIHPDEDISLEERRAQLPKYQRNLPRPAPAPLGNMGNQTVGPMGGMMPPQQQGISSQQGMRHPIPPQHGQYGGPHQGMQGYHHGGMPPYGQGHPMVPQYQGGPPRPPMSMRPPVMSQGGRY
ncbi:BUB3-interacting and GLEBS motif-containing protein ZNF207 isoform X2 [Pleurodeles waltl]|uniref:BUB3-interacting and GLEBS motif-containing protein ZNF207 isoform X2 n=1 Tax=Pleurodeles waltl TaxID=8319 RepID=UPI00370967A1